MKHRLLILLVFAVSFSFAQDLQDRARTAVSEKRFTDALALYRTMLAGNPTNVDYILWVARLSSWTGDYTGAQNAYSKALALQPKNVDALVGSANLFMWKHSYTEAAALLTEAHELAPSSTDVELAWSRYYHSRGDDTDAKRHVTKVLDLDHDNQEALRLEESLVPDHTVELRMGFEGDTLPDTALGAIEELSLSYLTTKGQVGVDFGHLDRFNEDGNRGGMHFSRNLNAATSIRAAVLAGGGGDIVAKLDWTVGISRKVRHGLVLGADYRHIAFRTVTVDAAIADVDYYFEKPVWIQTSYAANRTSTDLSPAILLRVNSRVRKNLTINAGYAHGTEVFQEASQSPLSTEFGTFSQDSYIGGVNLDLGRKNRLEGTYTLGRRVTGILQNTFIIALVHTL
jgi:YaiO family outer membrane protein